MLHSLQIRDLALIESAELRFAPGLNVISGETGGGKSLVVGALALLRGGRAPAGLVRHGADELVVEAELRLGDGERSAAVAALLRDGCDVEIEEGLLVIARRVDARGRSRVRIDGRPATLANLRALGALLLELHGQGESRSLMRTETQVEMLDAFAGLTDLRRRWAAALAAGRAAASRLDEAAGAAAERLARIEFLRFQVGEMERLGLVAGEHARLEDEHRVLAHADRLRELLEAGLGALDDADPAARDLLARAQRAFGEAAAIDPRLRGLAEELDAALERVAEASRAAQSALGDVELDPARLAAVEERLDEIRKALRRFGPTEEDHLRHLEQCRAELAALEDGVASPERLVEALDEARARAAASGRKLVRARRQAGKAFAGQVGEALADLAMADTVLRVAAGDCPADADLLATATPLGPAGIDLEVRINPGEPFQPLRAVASAGEMARLVLAIKKVLADRDRVPLVVFDEIDSEIGGRLGLQVGRKLQEVARAHQVVIVTHLPQVAVFADAHFRVAKSVTGGRTVSRVEALDATGVERELAAMALGEGADAAAIEEARRLLARARAAGG